MINKKIAILGSSGSIGTQALDVCRLHGISVEAPIACGQVIVKNLFDTGVDLVACMTLEKKEK